MESKTPRWDALRATLPVSYGPPEGPLYEKLGKVIEFANQLETELATEIKNKKEFERDWHEACDQVATQAARIAELELDVMGHKAGETAQYNRANAATLALSQAKDALTMVSRLSYVMDEHSAIAAAVRKALSTPERA